MIKRLFIISAILLHACISVSAKKTTDDALKNLCRDINNAMQQLSDNEAKQAAFNKQTAAWSKQYELTSITADQVSMVFQYGGLNLDMYLRRWLEPVLNSKAEKDAAFAFLAWQYLPENDSFSHTPKETTALLRFLQSADIQGVITAHPDYPDAIFSALSTMKDANWHTDGFPSAVLRLVEAKLPEEAVMNCVKAFNSIARVDNMDAAPREAIRKACIAQYEALLPNLDVARKQKNCNENIAYLKGPFACGTLVGGKAPELHFIRAFKQQGESVDVVDIKNLSAFKGKVIMLDFWGTKCVPCIQSFPEIAELQKHFEGKDVVVLGVTSLQGYFADLPNHRTVQCRNNPEKELGCFPDYMKAMGINWHIAVSEEDVMNTDYGVLAIPHVTIIDKQGNVRYNAINTDNEGKIKIINELLNE